MVAAKEYNKVDLKNTQLMSLATKIEALEKQLREKSATLTTTGSNGGRGSGNTKLLRVQTEI